MELQIYKGDYLDVSRSWRNILPPRILQYIDICESDQSVVLEALTKLMVLDLYNAGMARLLIKIEEYEDSFIADISSITDLGREYKIMNISEDTHRKGDKQQRVLIVDMARIERIFFENTKEITWTSHFEDHETDRFIIPVDTMLAMKMLDNPTENKSVVFSEYYYENILFDGKSMQVYFYENETEYGLNTDFKKLELKASKKGNLDSEEVYHDFLTNVINGYSVYLTSNNFRVLNKYEILIDTQLDLIEDTPLTVTYLGSFNDGRKFRLVKAGKVTEQVMKSNDNPPIITLASTSPNGYAVTFMLKNMKKHLKVPCDPDEDSLYFKKKNFNGQQLALLFIALSKNLLPKPTNNELFYEEHLDTSCTLYFKIEYYQKLIAAINEAYRGGKFSQSNNEEEWNNLKDSIESAESVKGDKTSTLKVYPV